MLCPALELQEGGGLPQVTVSLRGQFRALYNSTCQGWVLHRSEEQAAEKAVKLGRQLLEPTKEVPRSSEPRNPRSSTWGDAVRISKEIYLLLFIARDTVPKVALLEKTFTYHNISLLRDKHGFHRARNIFISPLIDGEKNIQNYSRV